MTDLDLIEYDQFASGEESQITKLVSEVFDQHVSPGFTPEGISEFKKFVSPEAIKSRVGINTTVFTAKSEGKIIGMVEIREGNHLAMLFVDSSCQGKRIGEKLLEIAISYSRDKGHNEMTVRSSPNSKTFYLRYGFEQQSEEQSINGIRFVPMKLDFDKI